MVDTGYHVPKAKWDRFTVLYSLDRSKKTVHRATSGAQDSYKHPTTKFEGGSGLVSTTMDYARFMLMLANEGELNGVRLVAPRSIELMRTNHLTDVEQATYRRPGQGWGLDFSVVTDGAASGESWSTGSYYWIGIAGTWFWVDPELDLTFVGMIQHSGVSINEVQQLSRSLVYQAVVGK